MIKGTVPGQIKDVDMNQTLSQKQLKAVVRAMKFHTRY